MTALATITGGTAIKPLSRRYHQLSRPAANLQSSLVSW